MSSVENPRSKWGQILRQFLLVIEMIGLEACVTLEVILMIANIQTLGVPIAYSSLPGTISAAVGVVMIPGIGLLIDKKAKSKSAKARILIFTSSLQLVGCLLIFAANSIKLMFFDYELVGNVSTPWANVAEDQMISNYSTPTLYSISSEATNSYTSPASNNASILPFPALPKMLDPNTNSSSASVTVEPYGYYSILAMIGYCMLDMGYDSSNCFLKTFALASTPPKDQSSIIVKSIFVSSFGGCLIAVMGSLGLGELLTAGTSHDSNAAQCALVSAVCFALLLSTLITSVTTGFCCPPSSYTVLETSPSKDKLTVEEKSRLVLAKETPRDLSASQQQAWYLSHGTSRTFLEKTLSGHNHDDGPRVVISNEIFDSHDRNRLIDQAELSPRTGVVGFLIRQKKQIIINVSTFFYLGALYSFEVFAVNFVGDGIFNGDPLADASSEEYKRYLAGIESGSVGTLIYYIMFTIVNAFQEILLDKVGWKVETIVVSILYVVTNLVCAITATLWSFYLCAVWTGIFRTVVVTVPYILANQLAIQQGGKDSGVTMATVAAMLPLGFTVCSAIMGPLIAATGNAATPIYYTAVNAFLGTVTISFLKIDALY